MDVVKYCLSKKGAFEDYPFGPEPLAIKISSKMFALISKRGDKINLSLKCDPFMAQSLREQYNSINPGYHLNKQHWNTINVNESIPEQELTWMIDHSYELVVSSLTATEKKSIAD